MSSKNLSYYFVLGEYSDIAGPHMLVNYATAYFPYPADQKGPILLSRQPYSAPSYYHDPVPYSGLRLSILRLGHYSFINIAPVLLLYWLEANKATFILKIYLMYF